MKNFDLIENGTISVLIPLTKEAQDFITENVYLENWQLCGNGFYCEPRNAKTIIEGFEQTIN